MAVADVDAGRASYERAAWGDAFARLSAAHKSSPLAPPDLERLALAAYLVGKDETSVDVLAQAHRSYVDKGEIALAARCAFWAGFQLMNRGEMARGGGWLARARRLLEDSGVDSVERGYLQLPIALQRLADGDAAGALDVCAEAGRIAERFGNTELMAMSRLGRGQALIRLGDIGAGVELLDEAMVAVTAGELSPVVVGTVYCAAIDLCQETFDLGRAQEWTAALTRWCESQPDLAPFRGQCLVYRAEIMQLRGAWADAVDEARMACDRLSGDPAVGMAFYQQAELHRLRGAFHEAEAAYRQASQWGRATEPGMALLRLAQGQVDAASAIIDRALDEAQARVTRAKLLPAAAEIRIAAGDIKQARAAADELASIANDLDRPLLHAASASAAGAVLLAEGDARAAISELRTAWRTWQRLDAPYESARIRAFIGLACRELGDEDTATMEFDAATEAFRALGAVPDVSRVEVLSRKQRDGTPGGLTAREIEVLRLVAAGKTNRTIADELVISEKTVARHISNIFAKLELSSRSAATAYAYQHGLTD